MHVSPQSTSRIASVSTPDGSDSAPSIRRYSLADMTNAERFVIEAIRLVIKGVAFTQLDRLAQCLVPDGPSVLVAEEVLDLVRAMDDPQGPGVRLHRFGCRRVGDDERLILRFLAAHQREDYRSAQTYAELLVSSVRVGALMHAGHRLTRSFSAEGLRFPDHTPLPTLEWMMNE